MAIIVNQNHTDTPVAGVTSLAFSRGILNYKADYCVMTDDPGEAIISNKTSPVDAPERLRFAMSTVKDVYQNTEIDPGTYSPSKRGSQILVQLTEVWTKSDATNASFKINLPVTGHIVLKVPNDSDISADMIIAFLGRLVSGLYETGSLTNSRINALLRGSMIPADL